MAKILSPLGGSAERLDILFNDEQFDQLVHKGDEDAEALAQASFVAIAVKARATIAGSPGAVIAFNVALPDGTIKTAQAVITMRQLRAALKLIDARYGDLN